MPSPEERFWSKVDQSGDCWLWTGARSGIRGNRGGYGQIGVGGRVIYTHRFAYELLKGPIPASMTLDHRPTCPKHCCNPDHLRPATNKQNLENRAGAQSNNHSSGIRGVSWDKTTRCWVAQVKHNGRNHRVGAFRTIAEAEAAAIAKRNELFTHNDMDRT